MNSVELKVSGFQVISSHFVHPEVDVTKALPIEHGQVLHPAKIHGIQYQFLERENHNSTEIFTSENTYTIFVKQGDVWIKGEVELYHWEWILVTKGITGVEANDWFAYKKHTGAIVFVTREFKEAEVAFWEGKALEDPETFGTMPVAVLSRFKLAVPSENGIWTY